MRRVVIGLWGLWLLFLSGHAWNPALESPLVSPRPARSRFEIQLAPGVSSEPISGRLLLILGSSSQEEPRESMTATGLQSPPRLGRDVKKLEAGGRIVLDAHSALFPQRDLSEVPAGEYQVQAVLMTNQDLYLPEAPGNWVSTPRKIHFDPARRDRHRILLDHTLPQESQPPDTDQVRFLHLRSSLLSTFWKRPMVLRAGILLPKGWGEDPTRRYPLLVRIGGFGTRYTWVTDRMKSGSEFEKVWNADATPRFVLLQLDGAGPLGDPYQVNSDNHGPYGDALVQELIPYVEAAYRCTGKPHARVLTGGSTGGWVSLALQVFYPDFFGGCWSGFPDPPDFRALQLVNLYADTNAFVNTAGFERPCAREISGDVQFTMRHETQLENVLGMGDSYVHSGGQWGSWNATYSPRDDDGRPRPIWNPRTGQIDSVVAQEWRRYDLRELLEKNWKLLSGVLKGKIHIWMGDADTYFLDTATRHLDAFLSSVHPPADARIEFAPRQPHGWNPRSWSELLREMQSAVTTNTPAAGVSHADYLRAKFMHGIACPHCRSGR